MGYQMSDMSRLQCCRNLMRGAPAIVLIAASLWCTDAHARRGAGNLISSGERVEHCCDLPPLTRVQLGQPGQNWKVGYCYNHFGVLWLNIWTWGGRHCLYHDNTIAGDVTATQIEQLAERKLSAIGKPLGYTVPPGLVIIVLGIVGYVVYKLRKKPEWVAVLELRDDPRYRRAWEIIEEHRSSAGPDGPQPPDDGPGFDKALEFLVGTGLPANEAANNLVLMKRYETQESKPAN